MNQRHRNGNSAIKEAPTDKIEVKKPEPIIEEKIEPEIIEPLKEKKVYEDVALIGKTTECRDFRAICAKNDWKQKDKLTEMLSKWNGENYNL